MREPTGDNRIKTSEDIQLSTHSQMSGTAEIILAEKAFIRLIWYNRKSNHTAKMIKKMVIK